MTWTAAIMPDDALPPDSLVGSMLNPVTEESSVTDEPVRPELLAEAREFLDEYADDFKALATVEPKRTSTAESPARLRPVDRYDLGDAIRLAWLKHGNDSWCSIADEVIALLTEQARIATELENHQ